MGYQHRRSERQRVSFQIVFDDGYTYSSGVVDDISETGMFLESAEAPPVGTFVRLEPPGKGRDALFEVEARVVRVEELDRRTETDGEAHHGLVGVAVEFIHSDDASRSAVRKMIESLR